MAASMDVNHNKCLLCFSNFNEINQWKIITESDNNQYSPVLCGLTKHCLHCINNLNRILQIKLSIDILQKERANILSKIAELPGIGEQCTQEYASHGKCLILLSEYIFTFALKNVFLFYYNHKK